MKITKREALYKEIKNFAIENFNIELRDEDLDRYGTDYLAIKLKNMEQVFEFCDEKWVLAYIEATSNDLLKAISQYLDRSFFYDYDDCDYRDLIEEQVCKKYGFFDRDFYNGIFEYLDCEGYATDLFNVIETEYGYIILR